MDPALVANRRWTRNRQAIDRLCPARLRTPWQREPCECASAIQSGALPELHCSDALQAIQSGAAPSFH